MTVTVRHPVSKAHGNFVCTFLTQCIGQPTVVGGYVIVCTNIIQFSYINNDYHLKVFILFLLLDVPLRWQIYIFIFSSLQILFFFVKTQQQQVSKLWLFWQVFKKVSVNLHVGHIIRVRSETSNDDVTANWFELQVCTVFYVLTPKVFQLKLISRAD